MKVDLSNRVVVLAGLLVLINVLYRPPTVPKGYGLKENDIAGRDIIAPYDFDITKSDEELAQARQELAQRIPWVFDYNEAAFESLRTRLNHLNSLFDSLAGMKLPVEQKLQEVQQRFPITRAAYDYLSDQFARRRTINALVELYSRFMFRGLVEKKSVSGTRIIMIDMAGREILESVDNLYDRAGLDSAVADRPAPFRELVRDFFTPNLVPNAVKTDVKINEVYSSIPRSRGKVLKGEKIVGAHSRVTKEIVEKVDALEKTRGSTGIIAWFNIFLGRNLFYLAIIFFFYRYDRARQRELLKKRNFGFLVFMAALFFVVVKVISLVTPSIYFFPIAFFAFIITLFLGYNAALAYTVALSGALALIHSNITLFYFLIISGIGAGSLKVLMKSRFDFYIISFVMAVFNIAGVILVHLCFKPPFPLLASAGQAFLSGFLSGFLVFFILPILERFFGITTDFTLLELGNLNRPIFKEMVLKAPGTYHHSIVVGSLAEAGASAIGGNSLLTRVAAYYHDIGKLKMPEYFIENQLDRTNPHDQLTPQVSVLVILSHVKEGVETAHKLGLPDLIVDIIQQHHGTGAIEAFYRKALIRAQGPVSDTEFRYPGPRPQTREAALVMLADGVEASARGERNITPRKLQKILKENIDHRFSDRQLDDCNITRKDLADISEAFLPILAGVFHPRLENENQPVPPAA